MIIEPGDKISLKHCSGHKSFKSIVIDVDDYLSSNDIITIRLTDECAELNIFEGDPVAITIQRSGEVYTTSCNIKEISLKDKLIKLFVENVDFIVNKRAYERFPVSIYVSVWDKDENDEFIAIAKNISYDGLMICSKKGIDKGQTLKVSLYLDEAEIMLSANIMWRADNESMYDYGLKIIHMEYVHQKILRDYIENMIKKQENFEITI